jgi:hypothetical protein
MSEHTTIYPASPSGTHPSSRSAGVHSFACDECGTKVRYAERLGEDYVWHDGEKVGYRDIGDNEDLCPACEKERFDETT